MITGCGAGEALLVLAFGWSLAGVSAPTAVTPTRANNKNAPGRYLLVRFVSDAEELTALAGLVGGVCRAVDCVLPFMLSPLKLLAAASSAIVRCRGMCHCQNSYFKHIFAKT